MSRRVKLPRFPGTVGSDVVLLRVTRSLELNRLIKHYLTAFTLFHTVCSPQPHNLFLLSDGKQSGYSLNITDESIPLFHIGV